MLVFWLTVLDDSVVAIKKIDLVLYGVIWCTLFKPCCLLSTLYYLSLVSVLQCWLDRYIVYT